MNIADPNMLTGYLQGRGMLGSTEKIEVLELSGGVSCLTILVRIAGRPDFVIKQARSKLKVAEDWFSDPKRIHIEAAAMQALQELAPAGGVPALLFEDEQHHLLAMEAVPLPHENWKSMLLQGRLERLHILQFAQMLAGIHGRSLYDKRYKKKFGNRHFFKTLRLDPYYAFTAGQTPEAAPFLNQLIQDTLAVQATLVHGDYSPKNILIFEDQLVLLDHEVMHFGDGAFDIGFSMTHLLSKARHLPAHRTAFTRAAGLYWSTYRQIFDCPPDWEERAVRHTIACMLARVRGKSPLEYLSENERDRQAQRCLELIREQPRDMETLIARAATP